MSRTFSRTQESVPPLESAAFAAPHETSFGSTVLFAITGAAALVYYAAALHWTPFEIVRCLVGMAGLWGPLAALLYFALQKVVSNALVTLTMSYAGSYVLTTLLYFAAVSAHVPASFVVGLIVAATAAAWRLSRTWNGVSFDSLRSPVVLLVIIAGSLATTAPYSKVFKLTPSGDRLLTGYPDQLYHTGLEYELRRHVPPLQASSRAGTPERAYHMFPHLTVVLIARFTGQKDMLRVQTVYHYAAMTVLVCSALYGIGFLLTNCPLAGYTCSFLPFLFAIATPPIIPNSLNYFFFTALPHATSSLFPTLFTSPQMFSGIAATYGVMLMTAATLRVSQADTSGGLPALLCAPMVAALLRFRVHCWMAVLPVFLTFVFAMWYRSKHVAWLISAGIATLVSGLLYAEMRLPEYLVGTTNLHVGLTNLGDVDFYQAWPFSAYVFHALALLFSGTMLAWATQIVCILGFSFWNIIGIPLFCAVLIALMKMRGQTLTRFGLFVSGMVMFSLMVTMCLNAGYDNYSLTGQIPYHLGWYLLPLGGISAARLISRIRLRTSYADVIFILVGLGCGCAGVLSQRSLLPALYEPKGIITKSGWQAFQYLKTSTPFDSVVLSSSPWDREVYAVSGLGGRAGYSEGSPRTNSLDSQAVLLNPGDNRYARMRDMAAARNGMELCAILAATPITHILEEPSNRLMKDLPCLTRMWTGPDGATAVWKLDRSGSGSPTLIRSNQ